MRCILSLHRQVSECVALLVYYGKRTIAYCTAAFLPGFELGSAMPRPTQPTQLRFEFPASILSVAILRLASLVSLSPRIAFPAGAVLERAPVAVCIRVWPRVCLFAPAHVRECQVHRASCWPTSRPAACGSGSIGTAATFFTPTRGRTGGPARIAAHRHAPSSNMALHRLIIAWVAERAAQSASYMKITVQQQSFCTEGIPNYETLGAY
jgi:hypothetical protein